MMDTLNTIKAIVILDADGKQLAVRYFDDKVKSDRFQKKIFIKTKTSKSKDDLLMIDGFLILHQFITDVHFYIISDKRENPLLIERVLKCITNTVTSLLSNNVERQEFYNHLPEIIIALDEIADGGMILETDSSLVVQRVTSKVELYEQSVAQKLQNWLRSD